MSYYEVIAGARASATGIEEQEEEEGKTKTKTKEKEKEKAKKPAKPGSKRAQQEQAGPKQKLKELQSQALAAYAERRQQELWARQRQEWEEDYHLKLNDELRERISKLSEGFHAKERRDERGVEWERLQGALKVLNRHNHVIGMMSEFKHYGDLHVESVGAVVAVTIREDNGKVIRLEVERAKLSRVFPSLQDRERILASRKDKAAAEAPLLAGAAAAAAATETMPVVFSYVSGQYRVLLDPSDVDKRKRYCMKMIVFGRDDNENQLTVVLSPNINTIVTMYFTRK